jgi:hypothetical protein
MFLPKSVLEADNMLKIYIVSYGGSRHWELATGTMQHGKFCTRKPEILPKMVARGVPKAPGRLR